jgi:hypothetical protein
MTYRLSLKDVLETMNSERARLERLYRQTDRYLSDALAWVPDGREVPSWLVEQVCIAYEQSTAFRTVIDDAEAGEVNW